MILLSVGEISYTIAVGLSIGCPRLVGRRIAINSNMQEFFCTTLYNVHIRCNGKKGPAQDKPTRGDESLGPHKYMDGRLVMLASVTQYRSGLYLSRQRLRRITSALRDKNYVAFWR